MSGGQEAGAYARAEWAANLLLSLLGEQEQVGVMVNEYLQIYKKRRGEEEGVFVFARDYRRGYWAEAPLAPSELATLLALLLAPPQKWRERLAGERYATLVVNGYVRVERGERDGALRVVVSDYRKNLILPEELDEPLAVAGEVDRGGIEVPPESRAGQRARERDHTAEG